MRGLRLLGGLLLVLGLLPVAGAGAAEREFSSRYDWSQPGTDYSGWEPDERDGAGAPLAPSSWYAFSQGASPFGPGLTIRPTGNGDQTYRGVSGRWGLAAPGTTTIRRAVYDGVTARFRERQGLRFGLYGGATPLTPFDINRSQDDLEDGTVTRTDPDATSRFATLWMFTEPCDVAGEPACQSVDPGLGSVNHADSVELTLVDRENPGVVASGPLWDARERWVRDTPDAVAVDGQDPGSGIRTLSLTASSATGTRRIITRGAACDFTHSTPSLGSAICPATARAEAGPGAIGEFRSGRVRLRAQVRDLAGQLSRTLSWQLLVDRQRPEPARAADLSRLDGKYLLAPPVTRVRALDLLSGVNEVRARVRSSQGERLVPMFRCASERSCPRVVSDRLQLRADQLAEGVNSVSIEVLDLAGNLRSRDRAYQLRVDRQGPLAPRLRREGSGSRAVRWSEATDPGGSGVGRYEYRLSREGVPGPFRPVPGRARSILLPNARSSVAEALEVRAIDRVGNAGRVARLEAVARASQEGQRCNFEIRNRRNTVVGRDAEKFVAENRQVGININPAACGPNLVQAIRGRVTITLKGRRIASETINYVALANPSREIPLHDISAVCKPSMDATQTYAVTLRPDGGAAQRPSGQVVPIVPPRGSAGRRTVRLACPTTAERQDLEVEAWRALGLYNPKSRRYRTTGGPSDILNPLLRPSLPFRRPSGVWAAHHVVPARERDLGLRIVQAGAFRCRQYPNSVNNGVWLRTQAAREGTALYKQMPNDRQRTWHPLTYGRYGPEYFVRLRSSLVGGGIALDGSCQSSSSFRSSLRRVRRALIGGRYMRSALERTY